MRKKHPEHVNLERWLVSYADFITLLFAFFVVMYALSQADMAKLKVVAESMRQAFGGTVELKGSSGGHTLNQFDHVMPSGGRVLDMPAGKAHTASDPDPELQTLKEKLEETVSLELGVSEISDKMQMVFDSRGLVVRLAAKDFFDHGASEVPPELRPLLDRIGRVVASTARLIRIEGHTDGSEAEPSDFPSDWELSAARAAWVAKYWIRRFALDPRRLGIAGYSHYRPLTDDPREYVRGMNRRVEIIILNTRYQ